MKNNTLDLTVIIPVHVLESDDDKQLLLSAIESVYNQKNELLPKEVIVITKKDTKKEIKTDRPVRFVLNDESFDNIQSQINTAVKEVKTSFFLV